MPPEPVLRRHADHDPSLICRPAFGRGLREELAGKGWALGGVIGLAPVPGSACDAGAPSVYQMPDRTTACRCVVCPRCGHHTGNSHQGHYWRACKVLAERLRTQMKPGETLGAGEWLRRTSREDWHFCCGNEFGCELEPGSETAATG